MSNPFASEYKEPSSPSNYLKLTEGVHVIRLLTPKSEVVSFFTEYAETADGKKQKICYPDTGNGQMPLSTQGEPTKLCWAFIVFNQDLKKVQVAEFSQKVIRNFLHSIAGGKIKNDWTKFDIQITRKGQGLDTEYSFNVGDTEELSHGDREICVASYPKIDLSKMEKGEDPFKVD
jgi:hypothetical protein